MTLSGDMITPSSIVAFTFEVTALTIGARWTGVCTNSSLPSRGASTSSVHRVTASIVLTLTRVGAIGPMQTLGTHGVTQRSPVALGTLTGSRHVVTLALVLTAALVCAVNAEFSLGTGLVTERPDVTRQTRARACHRVTRGAILTWAVQLTVWAPLARVTKF